MKILHIDLTGPYTEGATYQENFLPAEQVKLGHEVVFWATVYEWANGRLNYVGEGRKILDNGVTLQRLPYAYVITKFLSDKIRACKGLYKKLCDEKPDMIMIHDGQTAIISDVCRYVSDHPEVRFIADSHTDPLNSATNWLSKLLLHKLFYRYYMRKLYESVEALYCISPEVKSYISELYGLPDEKLRALPLGGVVLEEAEYQAARMQKRSELMLQQTTINIVHSGKLKEEKRTKDLLKAFGLIDDENVHLTLIGAAEGEVLEAIEDSSKSDPRISWLGWKSGKELTQYLCSGDIYILPGDVSATVQNAMCCRCGIIVYPYEIYKAMGQNEVCYVRTVDELEDSLRILINDSSLVTKIKDEAFAYAKNNLDYATQAVQLIEGK